MGNGDSSLNMFMLDKTYIFIFDSNVQTEACMILVIVRLKLLSVPGVQINAVFLVHPVARKIRAEVANES